LRMIGASLASNRVHPIHDASTSYAAAELRTKKVDEIRELLAVRPDPGDEEAVKFIALWRETGENQKSKIRSNKASGTLHAGQRLLVCRRTASLPRRP
jgi:hypothetical protein